MIPDFLFFKYCSCLGGNTVVIADVCVAFSPLLLRDRSTQSSLLVLKSGTRTFSKKVKIVERTAPLLCVEGRGAWNVQLARQECHQSCSGREDGGERERERGGCKLWNMLK